MIAHDIHCSQMQRLIAILMLVILAATFVSLLSQDGHEPPEHEAEADGGAAAAPPPVRAMSFNIRYGAADDGENDWSRRRGMVFDLIINHKPDVVGMQEALAFQLDELMAALPEHSFVGVGRDDGERAGEYSPILYRHERFDVLDHNTFWFSDTPQRPGSRTWGNTIPRICTWARLRDRDTGEAFYVFNVHLDHASQYSRERSAMLLRRRIDDREHIAEPVIVTGDFNDGERSRTIATMLADTMESGGPFLRDSLRDSFRVAHPDEDEVGTFHAFAGTTTSEKIDFVFVSDEWQVVEAAIVRDNIEGRYPSDHFPVAATVTTRSLDPDIER